MSFQDKYGYEEKPKKVKKVKEVRQKTEFSKKIIIVVSIFVLYIVVFSSYMMVVTRDLSPLSYLIPAIFVEAASATGFYYNKAKKENELKIKHTLGITDEEEIIDENNTDNIED